MKDLACVCVHGNLKREIEGDRERGPFKCLEYLHLHLMGAGINLSGYLMAV